MNRSQFTFYRSFWEAIQELPIKAKTEVICAICAYALDGEETPLTGTSKAVWVLIKPTLDASAKKAEVGKLGASKREANRMQTACKPEASAEQSSCENEKENEKENEGENEKENEKENECYTPHKGGPPRVQRNKYGEYGWVKLTQEEYARLLRDLGQTELERCIQYVDRSAQKTGNKNKWKDWNLVLRSCHREGWGKRQQYQPKGREALEELWAEYKAEASAGKGELPEWTNKP